MNGDYAGFIALAYGFAFLVMAGLCLSTLCAWKRARREAGGG